MDFYSLIYAVCQQADESLNFEEQILEAAKSIATATAALVKAASVAQRELVEQGKVSIVCTRFVWESCFLLFSVYSMVSTFLVKVDKQFLLIKKHTHTCLTSLCPGLPRWAGTRNVKPIWILMKQETVSGSGISWAVCKSAPRSRQITMPAPHQSYFYRPDALPAAQPTSSKHWRQLVGKKLTLYIYTSMVRRHCR